MESRIKSLREKRGLIQEILAAELGITQQTLSRYEGDVAFIKVDVLKKLAEYFNVTTDYLLGMSDMKRDLTGQLKVNEVVDSQYYPYAVSSLEYLCDIRSYFVCGNKYIRRKGLDEMLFLHHVRCCLDAGGNINR